MKAETLEQVFYDGDEMPKTILKSIKINEITHEDIVNFLSVALSGNGAFSIDYDEEFCKSFKDKTGDTIEDTCADILLHGGKIYITDLFTDDDTDPYFKETFKERDEDFNNVYFLTLDRIYKVFQEEKALPYVLDILKGEDDSCTGDCLLQICIFDEIVYG